jgi:hypothetical protein
MAFPCWSCKSYQYDGRNVQITTLLDKVTQSALRSVARLNFIKLIPKYEIIYPGT